MLNPTPIERRLDAAGRPYFLWDLDWTDERFRRELASADEDSLVELIAKLMRQAKPDDVFEYVSAHEVNRLWERVVPRLGQQRDFWVWLRGRDADEACVVDLVVDATAQVDPPAEVGVGSARVLVDSAQEILTNKVCALLSRSELRDLVDVRALIAAGADLDRAVHDAQVKDGGFSAAVLAWVLQGSNLNAMGRSAGATPDEVAALLVWRDELIARLLAMNGT